MIEILATAVAALAALGGFFAWRTEQLRRDEVLAWGLQAIDALQRLNLRCEHDGAAADGNGDIAETARQISVLAEQGRIFFQNASPHEYGQEKEQAYQGYRPLILDQLVFSFFVARSWETMSSDERRAGTKVVKLCKDRFVSLLQREVGRRRTADRYNKEAGNGYQLAALLSMAKAGKAPILPKEEAGALSRIRRKLRY